MSKTIPKCADCKNEIPVGKYYEVQEKGGKIYENYCSPCWTKAPKYQHEIKNGMLKVVEAEREREEREQNLCEKCQSNSVEVQLTEEGTQKTSLLCKDCAFEYTKCDKCQKKCEDISKWDEWQKNLITTEKDGKRTKVCSKCKDKGGGNNKKCSDCQTEKNPNELLTIQDQGKEIKICSDCKQKRDNNSQSNQSQDDPSTWQYTRYCEKCDKWLDDDGDVVVRYGPSSPYSPPSYSWIECKDCGSSLGETTFGIVNLAWSFCSYCHKRTASKEVYDKAKPNWKKRFVIEHGEEESGELFKKPIINHDCLIECKNNQGGKACGKEWKIMADNYWLLILNYFSFFTNNACPSCRLKELEEQITEAKKEGRELTDEGKEYYEELKKLVRGGSSGSSIPAGSGGTFPSSPFPTASSDSPLKTAETKKKQLKAVITSLEAISDKTPTQETQLTNKKQELKDIEELETVIKYFLENSIKQITMEGERLIISYSNGTKKTVATDTNQLKTIWERMKKVNKNSLLASELGLDYSAKNNPSPSKEDKGTNWMPWVVGGSIVGGLLVIGIIVYRLKRSKKRVK